MALGYYIMRKNDIITYTEMSEDGNMLSYSPNIRNIDLAPIQDRYQNDWLKRWWKERSVPVEQDNIRNYLRERGFSVPSEYLIKNLGLSLTDYYWIKPVDSDLKWEDVNLFDNPFTDNVLNYTPEENSDEKISHYSPNGTLQGRIEKTWAIINNERYLIKGNKTNLSSESLNEVIASEIHRRQGYDNYTDYKLIEIAHRSYDYGCISKIFTSQQDELISGFAVYTMEKKPNSVSHYDHLLNMIEKLGADKEYVRRELEYQILTDFVMSGYDRHLNNIAFIRDADTLEIKKIAPIYDSGGSFFANKKIPVNEKELFSFETYGFASRETGLLKLVKDRNLIDLTKLPPASYIMGVYAKDSQMPEKNIKNICHWYERKIELCRDFQLGKIIGLKYNDSSFGEL